MWHEDLLECPAELSNTSEFSRVLFTKTVSLYTEIMDSRYSKFLLSLIASTLILLLIWVYVLRKRKRKEFLCLLREGLEGYNKVNERPKNIESLLVNASSEKIVHLVK